MRHVVHSCPDRLKPLLFGYGLGKGKVLAILRKLGLLLKTRGIPGTLQYLKAVSNSFKSWYSKGDIPEQCVGSPWVKFRWWKRLVKKRGQLVKMCMAIHRVISLTTLSHEQWEKFDSAVNRDEPSKKALVDALAYVRIGSKQIKGRIGDTKGAPLWNRYLSSALTKTGGDLEKALKKAKTALEADLTWAHEQGLFRHSYMTDTLEPTPPFTREIYLRGLNRDENSSDDWIGNLLSIQEPGGKCRFAASPRLVVQAALEGLFQSLDSILYDIREDACHDQEAAFAVVEDWLKSGYTLWSTDISSATDATPLELQTCVLRELGAEEPLIDFYKVVSRADWSTSKDVRRLNGVQSVSWKVGQPLGVKPSFALFSLTMHCLLKGICYRLGRSGRFPNNDPYLQLGDDHVGYDPDVEKEFIRVLTSLGVGISAEKSVVSSRVAEFAGALIRHDGFSFRPGKWKSVDYTTAVAYAADHNFNPYRCWPKKWADLVMKLRTRPWPYGFDRRERELMTPEEIQQAETVLTTGILIPHDFLTSDLGLFLYKAVIGDFVHERTGGAPVYEAAPKAADHTFRQIQSDWRLSEHVFGNDAERRNRSLLRDQISLLGSTGAVYSSPYYMMTLQDVPPSRVLYSDFVLSVWATPFEKVITYPFLRKLSISRRCSTSFDVVGALIDTSPFGRWLDYSFIAPDKSFYSLLRRVADRRDVIPKRLCPRPVKG